MKLRSPGNYVLLDLFYFSLKALHTFLKYYLKNKTQGIIIIIIGIIIVKDAVSTITGQSIHIK